MLVQNNTSIWPGCYSPAALAMMDNEGRWAMAPHIALLNRYLLRACLSATVPTNKMTMAQVKSRRLVITMPPGYGKSAYVSHYLLAWFIGMFPYKRAILASYEASVAQQWGRRVMETLSRHEEHFHVKIKEDVKAAYRWETTAGGGMIAAGIGGPVTSRRAEIFVLDDAIKNLDQAYSPLYRERCESWFNSVAYTRAEPGCVFCVVSTRWHDDDIAGRMLKSGDWTHLNLPAIAEENDMLGRQPGEGLWPERHPLEELLFTRKQVGPKLWASLYQQKPTPDGGAIFNPAKLGMYNDLNDLWRFTDGTVWPHNHCFRFAVVDPSVGMKRESDPTAIGVFACTPDDRLLVLHMVNERIKLEDIPRRISSVCKQWGVDYAAVEANGYQIGIVRECRNIMGAVCPIRELYPHGKSKMVRAMQAVVHMDNGQIYIPRQDENSPEWLAVFLEQVRNWTGEEREKDDIVDCVAYASRQMITGRNILPTVVIDTDMDRLKRDHVPGLGLSSGTGSGFGGGMGEGRTGSRLDPFSGGGMRSRMFGF